MRTVDVLFSMIDAYVGSHVGGTGAPMRTVGRALFSIDCMMRLDVGSHTSAGLGDWRTNEDCGRPVFDD